MKSKITAIFAVLAMVACAFCFVAPMDATEGDEGVTYVELDYSGMLDPTAIGGLLSTAKDTDDKPIVKVLYTTAFDESVEVTIINMDLFTDYIKPNMTAGIVTFGIVYNETDKVWELAFETKNGAEKDDATFWDALNTFTAANLEKDGTWSGIDTVITNAPAKLEKNDKLVKIALMPAVDVDALIADAVAKALEAVEPVEVEKIVEKIVAPADYKTKAEIDAMIADAVADAIAKQPVKQEDATLWMCLAAVFAFVAIVIAVLLAMAFRKASRGGYRLI